MRLGSKTYQEQINCWSLLNEMIMTRSAPKTNLAATVSRRKDRSACDSGGTIASDQSSARKLMFGCEEEISRNVRTI